MLTIRDAKQSDAKRLLEIYDYYVRNTAISFEWETPSLEEFQKRMDSIMKFYPYLVALSDGVIGGYVHARPFIGRAAYDWTCETTIYLDHAMKGQGMGRKLYEALEDALRGMGITNVYACVGYPETEDEYLTRNSADFHAHLGYETVGKFQNCGYKFNRWYHMIWMEKIIGDHRENQLPVKGYPLLVKQK